MLRLSAFSDSCKSYPYHLWEVRSTSELVNAINVTNQTFMMKHRPVAPGWRVSKSWVAIVYIIYALQPKRTPAEFCQLMSIGTPLLNILGRAVEQLAVCLAKQANASSRGLITSPPSTPIYWGRHLTSHDKCSGAYWDGWWYSSWPIHLAN